MTNPSYFFIIAIFFVHIDHVFYYPKVYFCLFYTKLIICIEKNVLFQNPAQVLLSENSSIFYVQIYIHISLYSDFRTFSIFEHTSTIILYTKESGMEDMIINCSVSDIMEYIEDNEHSKI